MKRANLFFILSGILLLFMCIGCSSIPPRPRVVGEIKNVAKLATMEAVLSKIVIGTKQKKLMLGMIKPRDAAFLAYSEATVKVGIDLNKLREEDVRITENRISISLPPVELINFSYPAEKFRPDRYYSEDNSWWNTFDYDEKDALFREAELAIIKSIPYLGITETAEDRTRNLLSGLLSRMNFEEIYIDFRPQPVPPTSNKL